MGDLCDRALYLAEELDALRRRTMELADIIKLPASAPSDLDRLAREFWERAVLQIVGVQIPTVADVSTVCEIATALTAEWRKRFDPPKSEQFEKDMRELEAEVWRRAREHGFPPKDTP
jgi:hypothetical protein